MKKRKRRLEEDPNDVELIDADIKDQQILNEPDLLKPEAPKKFEEKTMHSEVEEKFKQIKRRPGEPILTPELCFTANVTSFRHCPQSVLQQLSVQTPK